MSHGGLGSSLKLLTLGTLPRMRGGSVRCWLGEWGGGMRVTYAWRWVSERGGKMPGEGGCLGSFDHAAVDGKSLDGPSGALALLSESGSVVDGRHT